MKYLFNNYFVTVTTVFLCVSTPIVAEEVVWFDGTNAVSYNILTPIEPVVRTALEMFSSDMQEVTAKKAIQLQNPNANISVIEADSADKKTLEKLQLEGVPVEKLAELTDGFHISTIHNQLVIVGTNGRGTAYGILELSRLAGVSPWIWWGDAVPQKREKLSIDSEWSTLQGASVAQRGIFINDEDWSLRVWGNKTYEPEAVSLSEMNTKPIGPRTYKRIFELLLRLRANMIWPAMHTGTTPFFLTPGAKAQADSFAIIIGTSHCEPLLRNNVSEWSVKERGAYNYITNRDAVKEYWRERLREVKNTASNCVFTVGMRGIHDGSMEGVKTMQEKKDALQQVIDDQQQLLREEIGNPEDLNQAFVPYKEVLDIYRMGLNVPDYVTLMWCDDNYGYMTGMPNSKEQERKGGNGMYYHLSYWGRPHDYLWLATTSPGLICSELRYSWQEGIRKTWIVNVHDVKTAGYLLELYLDLAWNINCVPEEQEIKHLETWLKREFGDEIGAELLPIMREYYQLCAQRKPEFMGWSEVELSKKTYPKGLSPATNTEFSFYEFNGEAQKYLEKYDNIAQKVKNIGKKIRPELYDAYFGAIEYQVLCSAAHTKKLLKAQEARQLSDSLGNAILPQDSTKIRLAVAQSLASYAEIQQLTDKYNNQIAGGKWNGLMCMRPRDLPVFDPPTLPFDLNENEIKQTLATDTIKKTWTTNTDGCVVRNAIDYDDASTETKKVQMLGHNTAALQMKKGAYATYFFDIDDDNEVQLLMAMIPTQPGDGKNLRYSITIDDKEPIEFSLREPFRSRGWKDNVLRGQAVKRATLDLKRGKHKLTITAIDDHIIADQWMIDTQKDRKFYLFPVE